MRKSSANKCWNFFQKFKKFHFSYYIKKTIGNCKSPKWLEFSWQQLTESIHHQFKSLSELGWLSNGIANWVTLVNYIHSWALCCKSSTAVIGIVKVPSNADEFEMNTQSIIYRVIPSPPWNKPSLNKGHRSLLSISSNPNCTLFIGFIWITCIFSGMGTNPLNLLIQTFVTQKPKLLSMIYS